MTGWQNSSTAYIWLNTEIYTANTDKYNDPLYFYEIINEVDRGNFVGILHLSLCKMGYIKILREN